MLRSTMKVTSSPGWRRRRTASARAPAPSRSPPSSSASASASVMRPAGAGCGPAGEAVGCRAHERASGSRNSWNRTRWSPVRALVGGHRHAVDLVVARQQGEAERRVEGDGAGVDRRGDGAHDRAAVGAREGEEAPVQVARRGRRGATRARRRRSGRRPRRRGRGRRSRRGTPTSLSSCSTSSDVPRKCSKKTLGSRARRSRPSHQAGMTAMTRSQSSGMGRRKMRLVQLIAPPQQAPVQARLEVGHAVQLADGGGAPVELLQPGAVLRREPELELVEVVHEVRLAEVVDLRGGGGRDSRRRRARVARREERGADGGGRLRPRVDEVAARGAHRVHHRQAGDALPLGAEVEVVRVRLHAQQVQRLVADEQQRVEVLEHLGERPAPRRELGLDAPLPAEHLEQADGGRALLRQRDPADLRQRRAREQLDGVDGAEGADGHLRQQHLLVGVAREGDRGRQR